VKYDPHGSSWSPGEKLIPREEVGPKGRSWYQGEKFVPWGEFSSHRRS
jgi:hypothetical protein